MKRTIHLSALLPGTALAHGRHDPVPDAAHGLAHVSPLVWILAIGAVALALWLWRTRS